MPSFVDVDPKPFHPDTYMGPEHENEDSSQGQTIRESMTIKLKVENTVRWRWFKDASGKDVGNILLVSFNKTLLMKL
jgi:RNA polymerase-associated protein LEO1